MSNRRHLPNRRDRAIRLKTFELSAIAPRPCHDTGLAWTLLLKGGMSFAAYVDRARTDFTEMPEMELTLPQAVRLWAMGMDDCRYVIDALVDSGFLAWTPRRTIVRRGWDPLNGHRRDAVDVSVSVLKRRNNSV
jgi:hypothetical protein